MQKLLPYEVWRDIKGYEGLYQVSARGRVKSLGIKLRTSKKDIIMKPPVLKSGYKNIVLSKSNRKSGQTIHRLVAIHFIPNTENKKQVNHIDGNKTNNSASNLEWVTQSENMTHAGKTGLLNFTEKRRKMVASITAKKVINTATGEVFETITEAAKRIGKHRKTLSKWLTGELKNKSDFRFA